jgi:hypothetical protein
LIKYSSYQFSFFRIYLGLYLLFISIQSFPSSVDIWSNEGIVPKANLNLTYGFFPDIINYLDSPIQVKIFLVIFSILALVFTLGIHRKVAAFLLWYDWACLLNRNNLTINPSIHYIGWLLLACTIIPTGESLSLSKQRIEWQMPPLILAGAWILFVAGYFISGIDKFHSPSWMNGTAFKKIMNCPLGYNWNSNIIKNIPGNIFYILNWLALAIEVVCLPLALFRSTRKWSWCCLTLLQLMILFTINISPIVFGMLPIHFFTFNHAWFRKKKVVLTTASFKKNKTVEIV